VSSSFDTTTTASSITIISSHELTTAATIFITHVPAIADSLSSLTSPISSSTDTFLRTAALNVTIAEANA
jgi:hypothetical protein